MLLVLAVVGQMPALFQDVLGVFAIFSGRLDAYAAGRTMGHLFYWVLHFGLMYVLWQYGRQWTKAPVKRAE